MTRKTAPLYRIVAAIGALWLLAPGWIAAAEVRVSPADGPLQPVIERLQAGDTLVLGGGDYPGPLVIDRPVTLRGEPGARVLGAQQGNVIRIASPGVTLRTLTIRDSGRNLTAMHAGVFIEAAARGAQVLDSRLESNLFGIWVDGAPGAIIAGNSISGIPGIRSQDRGNGIHLSTVSGARVSHNEVWETRDGIYLETSNDNLIEFNRLHDLRFGIHYMYSNRNRIAGNRTHRTRTGYALMQSTGLTVDGNRSEGDQNYGILMNFITDSTITNNRVVGVQGGRNPAGGLIAGAEGKAIFIYNSAFNDIRGNLFAASELGIHVTAGSEENVLRGNAFVGNRQQVKYVATRRQEWSADGRGNFWSDYLGWDLDGDGVGDIPYEPVDGVDILLWKYPLARTLMNSPAIEALRLVQRVFPVLRPPGVRDSGPLMRPPFSLEERS